MKKASALLSVVSLVLLMLTACAPNAAPTDAADVYLCILEGDASRLDEAVPPTYWAHAASEKGVTVEEYKTAVTAALESNNLQEYWRERCSDNYTVSYTVTSAVDTDDDLLASLRLTWEEYAAVDPATLTGGVTLTVELLASGDTGDDTLPTTLNCVCIDGRYYSRELLSHIGVLYDQNT